MATNLRERAESGAAKTPTVPAPRGPEPTAPEVVPIHVALARVMAQVRSVAKDDFHNSPTAKFNFRGIDAVLNAVGPALRDHGVIVLPEVKDVSYRDVQTSSGKPAREVTVRVAYTFVGPDGSTLTVTVPGESMDSGDKGTAKAMSVAFRVALLQTLALPTTERDPDHDAYERAPEPPADPMMLARTALMAQCRHLKLAPAEVGEAFVRAHGMTIPESDADTVAAFTAALVADPKKMMAKPEGAKA